MKENMSMIPFKDLFDTKTGDLSPLDRLNLEQVIEYLENHLNEVRPNQEDAAGYAFVIAETCLDIRLNKKIIALSEGTLNNLSAGTLTQSERQHHMDTIKERRGVFLLEEKLLSILEFVYSIAKGEPLDGLEDKL